MRKCISLSRLSGPHGHFPDPHISIRGMFDGNGEVNAWVAHLTGDKPCQGGAVDVVAGLPENHLGEIARREIVFRQVFRNLHIGYIYQMMQIRNGLSEATIHRSVVKLLRTVLLPSVVWFHIPNGELRDPVVAGKLKGMGVVAGLPDLCLMWTDKDTEQPVTGWIELKSEKGRLSDKQADMIGRIASLHHHFSVARSVQDVADLIARWDVPRRSAKLA